MRLIVNVLKEDDRIGHLSDKIKGIMNLKDGNLYLNIDMNNDLFKDVITKENILKAVNKYNLIDDEDDMEVIDTIDINEIKKLDLSPDNIDIFLEDNEKTVSYIENNERFKDYHLYFLDKQKVDIKAFKSFYHKYSPYNNIMVSLEDNITPITINEYKYTVETIEYYANIIKSYILSPLEQVMFAYDMVRNRTYIEENEEEDYTDSRDLTKIILGDKIVCVGFQKLFSQILNHLGIENSPHLTHFTTKKFRGHIRSMVRIDDEKYDIHGQYYFDPTWDCKNSLDDKEFIDSYKMFALTKKSMDRIDERVDLSSDIVITQEIINELKLLIETKNISNISFDSLHKLKAINAKTRDKDLYDNLFMIKTFGCLTSDDYDNSFIQSLNLKEVNYERLKASYNRMLGNIKSKNIHYESLIDAFITVRLIENSLMPDLFAFSEDDIKLFAKSRIQEYNNDERIIKLFNALFEEQFDKTDLINEYINRRWLEVQDRIANYYPSILPEIITRKR